MESKPDVFLRHTDGRLEQVAFGEAEGCADVAGIDVCGTVADSRPGESERVPRFVSVALKTIAAAPDLLPGAQLVLTRLIDKRETVFSLPIVVDEEGEIADKLLYFAASGSVRQRRACFVEVPTRGASQRCVLIVEGRTSRAQPAILLAVRPSQEEAASLALFGTSHSEGH